MVHFQTKDHMVSWLERHCPRKSIVRAINNGKVELLGGFEHIPPSGRPGWITRITSEYGRKWEVAIVYNKGQIDYGILVLNRVPWKHYCGFEMTNRVYRGDNPDLYKLLKERSEGA